MIKDINKGNWIIPPWDKRYGKLGHIWCKFKYNENNGIRSNSDFIRYPTEKSTYYYIPPELILNNYERYGYFTSDIEDPNLYNPLLNLNWCSTRFIRQVLLYTCNLTVQEYFDLMELHINNITDRPRCPYCKSYLKFSERILSGYGSGGHYWHDSISQFCSIECAVNYRNLITSLEYTKYKRFISNGGSFGIQHNNPLVYGNIGFRNEFVKYLTIRNAFINRGAVTDTCYFFIASTIDGYIKYGITECPELRKSFNIAYNGIKRFKFIFSADRVTIANLKYLIDIDLQQEESYFTLNESQKFRSAFIKALSSTDQLDI